MELIGKSPIHPLLFYPGKIAGYVCWILLFTSVFNIYNAGGPPNEAFRISSLFLAAIGVLLTIVSLINLGSSTRLGVPTDDTSLKTKGLYRFSRNPMYLGFDMLTISAIFYTWNIYIAIMAIFSLIIYHMIIIGEEKFLKQRFGEEYKSYIKKVRRYI